MTCIIEHRAVAAMAALYGADRTACAICKLPIGVPCDPEPSTITPDVAIEIRAAEIAAGRTPGWCETAGELANRTGDDIDLDTFGRIEDANAWLAGWLAREIATTPCFEQLVASGLTDDEARAKLHRTTP